MLLIRIRKDRLKSINHFESEESFRRHVMQYLHKAKVIIIFEED